MANLQSAEEKEVSAGARFVAWFGRIFLASGMDFGMTLIRPIQIHHYSYSPLPRHRVSFRFGSRPRAFVCLYRDYRHEIIARTKKPVTHPTTP